MITTLKIKQGLRNLIFGKSAIDFEDQLSLLTSISISFILILSTVFNSVAGLKNSLVILSAAGALLYFGLYLWGRIAGLGRIFYWIIGLVSLFYADLVWYVNYGSKGPIMPLFVVLYAYLILVFSRKQFVVISVLLYLNLLLLFVVELVFSEEIGDYPDARTRIMDNYMGIVFCLLVIYSFLAAIKKNYIREFERAKMSDQLKSAFLANMSHEIRTPLNSIVGFSSLITEPDFTDDDKRMFREQIASNSNYLLNLIEDIIDVSKLESNQLAVKVQDVDVVPLIRQISQAFQLSVNPGKNVVVVNRLGTSKMVVRVDPVRLGQILRNLLSNAVKFTEEGEIEVGCIKENGFFVFFVKDSGIGIHTEHHQVIFDRFFKIENNTNLYPGTGIGLFLSKQLVEMFGGRIWVESEVGKGANFYFTIPE
ncbi:MAG: HAMP domain-containing histidine kinase [Prolixibacteraceae bacterium]|nr:HAMP domain-containing histidine kinase [Prolixibacteraceae bacterium]